MPVSYYISNRSESSSIHCSINYIGTKRFIYIIPNSKIKVREWGKGSMKISRGKQENSRLQNELDRFRINCDEFYIEYKKVHKKVPDKEAFLQFFRSEKSINEYFSEALKIIRVLPLIKEIIHKREIGEELKVDGRRYAAGTIKAYKNILVIINEYSLNKNTIITNINIETEDLINDIRNYLTVELRHRHNYITNIMKTLKLFIEKLVKNGIVKENPFKKHKIKISWENGSGLALTKDEFDELFHMDLTKEPRLEKVRDHFIIMVCCSLRISDLGNYILAASDKKIIELYHKKTNSRVEIPVTPKLDLILKKYNYQLPKTISEQKMRCYLKEILVRVDSLNEMVQTNYTKGGESVVEMVKKLDLISLHSARRTFCTILIQYGFPYHEIMLLSNHKTVREFEKYVKINKKETIISMSDKLQNVF